MSSAQSEFSAALLDPSKTAPPGLIDGTNRPAGRRFDVYRNNVVVALGDALLAAFPLVTRILGPENMKGIAALFLRAHPPQSPVMQTYGAAFPAFLANMPQLSHLGYLADCARFDLLIRQAYHAADSTPINPQALAILPPDALMQARFTLAPAFRLLRSDWPVHDIWRFNMTQGAPKPRSLPQDILITRREFDPAPHLLPPGGAAWITALAQGETIENAYDIALNACQAFDLEAGLALLLQENMLISLARKDPTL